MIVSGDSLVRSITPLNKRPVYLHGYLAPFILLYGVITYFWFTYFQTEQFEIGIALYAAVFFIQVLSFLFCFWSVNVRCFLTCTKLNNATDANYVRVDPTLHNGSSEIISIQKQGSSKIWFEFQKVVYFFDTEEKKQFRPVTFPINETFKFYQTNKGFKDEEEYKNAFDVYGNNKMEMVIPEFKELFMERATAPFFVFQVFCVGLWCLDEYWYYSIFTLFMLIAFEASLVYQQLRNMSEIRKMGNKSYPINVYRGQKWRLMPSNELVAGDIISLTRSPSGVGNERNVPCDVLLLRGRLIVDEAMLTGESIPQMKEPIENGEGSTILDLPTHSRVHIVNGGTRVVQHDPPAKNVTKEGASRPTDNGCLGYVLQTGFNTSQGKLLRTILFGVKRVTANNLETFAFIMFLLIFAIAASAYVWIVGSADPKRSRYQLVLNCVLILTSVVPPELPIELSLAVNSSLLALSKLYVFCTEPFRIPFAGKLDICCFDKTGTLTSDCLVVEGIAGVPLQDNEDGLLCPVLSSPVNTQKVLASCHSLSNLEEDLVGDPLEQAMFKSVQWNLTKGDVVIPKKKTAGLYPLKIVHRFHFTSHLKRMSTVLSQEVTGSVGNMYSVACKGAAETLKPLFTELPPDYDEQHQVLSGRGARVLALGVKELGKSLTPQQIRNMKREDAESGLTFVGFAIVSSPLKKDSKAVMKEIKNSTHHVTMITGDNPLTACYVGRELKFTGKNGCLILTNHNDSWSWKLANGQVQFPLDVKDWKSLVNQKYDLCITGDGFSYLIENEPKYLKKVLPEIRIFARTSPKQKEKVITSLQQLGFYVLMCGDGTNDVGALKHANIGVALLSNTPDKPLTKAKPVSNQTPAVEEQKGPQKPPKTRMGARNNRSLQQRSHQSDDNLSRQHKKLKNMLDEMESDPQVVKMGDASIAAPFSYKLSSILVVCHIIKQGRCTLVTTLQMFKILALNALVLAYSQSVLFLDGVKFSDTQATLQGLLLAGCFLFVSRSKPLKVLSKQRPLPNIFNSYTILSITAQFAVHFTSLVFLVQEVKIRDPIEEIDFEADFEPNLLNSTVYLLALATQIITFGINYRGRPFMESLYENKPLFYSLFGSGSFLCVLLSGWLPDVNEQFEIVVLEGEFQLLIAQVLLGILVSTWVIDRSLRFVLGSGKLKKSS